METLFKLGMIFALIDRTTGPAREIMKAVSEVEKSTLRANRAIQMGKEWMKNAGMVAGAAWSIQAGLGRLVRPAVELEDAMAPLSTVMTSTMGSVTTSLEASRKAAASWAREHTNSAADFIRTQYMMASAGLNDIQSIEGTRVALAVATATMGDATEAANLVATAYNNIGDRTRPVNEEMTRLGDILTRTQQYFQFENLGQLNEGLTYAMPAALQAGTSFEELNVVLGQLNNAGLQGSMAGSAFAASMRQMLKASSDLGFQIARDAQGNISFLGTLMNLQEQFGPMSRWSDDLRMKFQAAFGDEGLRAISLLLPQIEAMRGALGAVANSAGAAAKAQAAMEATGSSQWRILLNNIDEVKRQFGDVLLPVLTGFIPALRRVADAFSAFTQAHPTLAKTAVLAVAVAAAVLTIAAPLMMVAGSLAVMGGVAMRGWALFIRGASLARTAIWLVTLGVRLFSAALLANPVGLVIAGIVALGAALYALITHWDAVKLAVTNFFAWLRGVLQGVPDAVLAAFPLFLVIKHWDAVKGAAGRALDFIRNLAGQFREAGAALWAAFTDGLKSVLSGPVNVVQQGLQRIRNMLPFSDAKEGPLSALTASGMALMQTLADGVRAGIPGLRSTMATALAGPMPALAGAAAGIAPALPLSAPAVNVSAVVQGGKDGRARQIVVQGGLHVHVEKVDSTDDLVAVLKRFAAQVGDGA